MAKFLFISFFLLNFAIGIVGSSYPMTRAKLAPPFPIYKGQDTERVSKMDREKLKNLFVEKANKKHNFMYNYDDIKYVNCKTNIYIRCNTCGLVFPQTPDAHLAGKGCPACGLIRAHQKRKGVPAKRNNLVAGVGVNDYNGVAKDVDNKYYASYRVWQMMLHRCYNIEHQKKRPSYKECFVCNDWLFYSNFKKWFDENYIEGYELDKDILVKGNKVYSPDTCCFVPPRINSLFTKCNVWRGDLPIGVTRFGKKFRAMGNFDDRRYLGLYNTPEDAFRAYKEAKEAYIKKLAIEYYKKREISEKVYNALMYYKVEFND